ncbi:hypothetical protein MSTO_29080 [Mycobacterium stomatepiae]|uniref:AMP-dependent synthetase/ligase domain-containing protein n=1 Tax=Mycobacterium stomatepiae TaxID=470076 RepID=A0A7I7Q8T6_9MYCO|nr:hypothetical protein MSTO_29080 [Mycobacterium stomatepiae]
MSIQVAPGHELALRLEFDTDVFDPATIETLIERLQRVLEAMTAEPGVRLSSIEVLEAGERARLDRWSNRDVLEVVGPVPVSVPALFAQQVTRVPEAVAVSFAGASLTYRQLDEASNRVAQWLVGRGVGAGQCVALVMPRGARAITAIVGCSSRGGLCPDRSQCA